MIFVVVGTQKFQLNRLLKVFDTLLEEEKIDQEVFAQIGNSDYIPKNYEYKRFLESDAFSQRIKQCSVLVTHGGVATVMAGLREKKPVIVFPRLAKYGEHVDDHQLEIAEAFCNANYVLLCKEDDDLKDVLQQCEEHSFAEYVSHQRDMVAAIDAYITENV